MQTFVPELTFDECARVLDDRRLGKQRVEAKQIYMALSKGHGAWFAHPAVQMWRDTPRTLLYYGFAMCEEWINRGFDDNLRGWFVNELLNDSLMTGFKGDGEWPSWWGGEIHLNHRAILLHKDFEWYSQWEWDLMPTRDYFWPEVA